MSSVMDTAQAHISLADSLNAEVIESLKVTERRQEEAKKRQEQYFAKLLSERDKVYADRIKVCIAHTFQQDLAHLAIHRASRRSVLTCHRGRAVYISKPFPVRRRLRRSGELSTEAGRSHSKQSNNYNSQEVMKGRADDRHAERAAKQFEAQQVDMQNSKK